MDKAPDAFRTISEVADELDVPQHVLRFWETRFPQIKPMKRGGGRRYYRPDDVDLLRGIRHLLYGEGYTIRGVQRLLKDNGLKFVQGIWKNDEEAGTTPVVPRMEPGDLEDEPPVNEVSSEEDEDAVETSGEPVRIEPVLEKPPARHVTVTLTRGNPVVVSAEVADAPRIVLPTPPAPPPPAIVAGLSAEDRRKLEAALFELGECRRLLDAALKE